MVYTNETYKPNIHAVKLSYTAGREARLVPLPEFGSPAAGERMAPGSVVALHSAYAGGLQGLAAQARFLQEKYNYNLEPVAGGVFESSIVPLLPDIMEVPGTHQNPLAWFFRYQPQHFQTRLFLVR